jgi:hypothetical protein
MINRIVVVLLAIGAAGAIVAVDAGDVSAATHPSSLALRATYDASAQVSWQAGTLSVESTAVVTNTTAKSVQQLTFNLITLRTGAATLSIVSVDGTPVAPSVSGQTINVPLPAPLAPAATTSVTVSYEAKFNSLSGAMGSLLVKKSGIVTAYRWIPWLSRQQAFNAPNFGETWVTAVSPRVRVWLKSDVAVKFATTGTFVGIDNGARMYVARDVRDFNFSASAGYKLKTITWRGKTLDFYTRTLPVDTLVNFTVATLNRMSDLIGAYPYAHLTVAEMPEETGMESPAMNWISATMTGSRLRYMIVHEVAHQWFYSSVGSNQATEPFADEAVADFFTRDQLGMFRSPTCATARLDLSVYSYSRSCYNEAIYVQGGLYLRWYRTRVGSAAFWSGLSNYVAQYADGLAGTRKLLDALDAASGFDSSQHATRFPSLYP